MNFLIFGGVNTRDYGVYINHDGIYNTPARAVERVEVPGRNGDVIRDQGRFENVTVTYGAHTDEEMKARFGALRQALMSQTGYQRLEDTYRPEEFRVGRFTGDTEVSPSQMGREGYMELTFDCKPQRFLKSGEESIYMAAPRELWNYGMESLPMIRVYGNVNDDESSPTGPAYLTIGDVTIRIDYLHNVVGIDCETQDAFKNNQNCNGHIYAPAFPSLKPGRNEISWSGNIAGIDVIPRWWTV